MALKDFHADVLPLAEGAVYYETKCTPEFLTKAKHVIKDYLEVGGGSKNSWCKNRGARIFGSKNSWCKNVESQFGRII